MFNVHLEMSTQNDLSNATHPYIEHSISRNGNLVLTILGSIKECLKSTEVEIHATREIAREAQNLSKALYVATYSLLLLLLLVMAKYLSIKIQQFGSTSN